MHSKVRELQHAYDAKCDEVCQKEALLALRPEVDGLAVLFAYPVAVLSFIFHILHERLREHAIAHYSSQELRDGPDCYYVAVNEDLSGIRVTFVPGMYDVEQMRREIESKEKRMGDQEAIYKEAYPEDHPDAAMYRERAKEAKAEHKRLSQQLTEQRRKLARAAQQEINTYTFEDLLHPTYLVCVPHDDPDMAIEPKPKAPAKKKYPPAKK